MRLSNLITPSLLVLTLAACGDGGGSGGGDADKDDVWRPDSDVPTAVGEDGLTPPGAVLKPGDTAHLMMADSILSDANYFPVEVIVQADAVSEADRAALVAELEAVDSMTDADDLGDHVWFVRATITAGADAAGENALLDAVDSDGDGMDASASSGLSDCAYNSVPEGGGTFETCTVVHSDSGDRPVAVSWEIGPEEYDDDPVLWYLGG